MNRSEYPRVSHILSQVKDFSHINPQVLAAKANDGTIVHKAIAAHLSGELPFLISETFCNMTQKEKENDKHRSIRRYNYYFSFLKWQMAVNAKFNPEYLDQRFYNDVLCYTGAIDGLFHFNHGDKYILVDFKTSAQVEDTWILQGHMYLNLLEANNAPNLSDKIYFLKLCPEGGLPHVEKYTYTEKTWQYCKQLIFQYHEKKKVDLNCEVC